MIEATSVDMIVMMTVTTTTTTTTTGHTGEDPLLPTTAEEDHTGHDHALVPTLLVITEVKFNSFHPS